VKRKRAAGVAITCLGLLQGAPVAVAAGTPSVVWEQEGHDAGVQGVAFTDDGSRLLSGAGLTDSRFRLWSAGDGAPAGEISFAPHAIHSVDAVPGSPKVAVGYVVSGYPPGGVAGIWDTELGVEELTAAGCFVDVSPDGAVLASGGGGVNRQLALTRIADGAPLHSISTGSYVHDVAWSPDGTIVATAGSDNAARLWDPETGQLVLAIPAHDDDVSAVAFSPDGVLLATGAGGFDATDDASIRIWRVADGELVRTLAGHGDWVNALAFSPDGGTLLSAGRTGAAGELRFWSVADGTLLQSFDAPALDVAYSPDGATFAYGSAFGDVVVALSPGGATGVEAIGTGTRSLQASPNPLESGTRLSFRLATATGVRLDVYDASGRLVARLAEGSREAGEHAVRWNGRDLSGRRAAPGVYFARLAEGASVSTRKLVVVR